NSRKSAQRVQSWTRWRRSYPELRSLYSAIRVPRVANIDCPLNTLKGVSVRTEQILEESYPVAAHRRRASRQTGPPSRAHMKVCRCNCGFAWTKGGIAMDRLK